MVGDVLGVALACIPAASIAILSVYIYVQQDHLRKKGSDFF